MTQCCGQQSKKEFKIGSDACFTCLGCSQPHLLEAGHEYPTCSPLVAGETKQDPWRPMSAPDECIVGWIGPCCAADATDWEEAKPFHVYPEAVAIVECANWPEDEEGNSLFSKEDLELIAHAHHCCIHFDRLKECQQAPDWVKAQNQDAMAKA